MRRLGVNIDHIATIRQARGTPYPNILEAARCAQKGGADQITVHLREDRRHIQDADLQILSREITLPLNLEMAAVDEITTIAAALKPQTATLVPERREEQTTESGLNVVDDFSLLEKHIRRLQEVGIKVSLFIDPRMEDVRAAAELKVFAVEFHTGPYSLATSPAEKERELAQIKEAVSVAKKAQLSIVAGHGLHYENTTELICAVPEIEEVNTGHAIVARAVFVGLTQAVREMKELL